MYRTALARTHRPRRFSELVGQDHVASTLRRAVESGRTAHAYLFCGPRGIGKTTAARVLAMALNCPNREDGEPCGTCESCESIWSGRTALDVVEIDAASNRGVDDARDLRERAMYAPSDESRYKVYIIDEAHMLTREAWNALLKILEEPPPRVIFVFATTEPQKIKQTAAPVLSRVQRFDFRRVSVRDLLDRLRQVVEAEGAEADEAALIPIARRADGGVRDALSLLDQVLSFSGSVVRVEDVRRMLGLVEEEKYLELMDLAERGDRAGVFTFVRSLLDEGYDLAEFVRGLGEALRLLLALRLDPETVPEELPEGSRRAFLETASRFGEPDLLRMLSLVAEVEATGRFRRSAQPRIQLEVLLLRLCAREASIGVEELLALLEGAAPTPTERRAPDRRTRGAGDGHGRTRPEAGEARGTRRASAAPPVNAPEGAPGAGSQGATAAESEKPPGAEDAPSGPTDLRAAWTEAIAAAQKRGLRGEAVGLKGATVKSVEPGVLQVGVPAGLGGDLRGFLEDRRRSAVFREELARRLSTDPAGLGFRVEETGERRRLTAETARDQRLERMMETDPGLRAAVQSLDLKLKE
jgi:DNA polymerase-3 subunit gamma/tau